MHHSIMNCTNHTDEALIRLISALNFDVVFRHWIGLKEHLHSKNIAVRFKVYLTRFALVQTELCYTIYFHIFGI